jgi:hypothetical protein
MLLLTPREAIPFGKLRTSLLEELALVGRFSVLLYTILGHLSRGEWQKKRE